MSTTDNSGRLEFKKPVEETKVRHKGAIKLTALEVEALLSAAGNGYADGEYFCDANGGDSGYGGKRLDSAYVRAIEKLGAGLIAIENEDVNLRFNAIHTAAELAKIAGTTIDPDLILQNTIGYAVNSAIAETAKQNLNLLKENQELKAELQTLAELSNTLLKAMDQRQFFFEGYANGSASISECNVAADNESKAYCNLWNFLKNEGL